MCLGIGYSKHKWAAPSRWVAGYLSDSSDSNYVDNEGTTYEDDDEENVDQPSVVEAAEGGESVGGECDQDGGDDGGEEGARGGGNDMMMIAKRVLVLVVVMVSREEGIRFVIQHSGREILLKKTRNRGEAYFSEKTKRTVRKPWDWSWVPWWLFQQVHGCCKTQFL